MGFSREFFVETQAKHWSLGECRAAQSEGQFPGVGKGAGLRPLRPRGVAARQGSFVHEDSCQVSDSNGASLIR